MDRSFNESKEPTTYAALAEFKMNFGMRTTRLLAVCGDWTSTTKPSPSG